MRYERFSGVDAVPVTRGSSFTPSVGFTSPEQDLGNGSVQLIVNGVCYLSNTDQSSVAAQSDFYISGQSVILQTIAYGGTLNIQATDDIGIYYQVAN